ncbi:hypothetical protein [Sphingomonas sp. AP4-R1]|uniref:hypothetical protein n=1 Tax=Sphingomonas sp. AP4-R1 TaxID=2735134 RepID=UPI0020A4F894|nr:hypothetical protein [Sphingomonas sp. AP4-R1]
MVAIAAMGSGVVQAAPPIDRQALVTRHGVHLTKIDPHAPVMLGNGELGFTADITGLQTFADRYTPIAPLLTMAQWAWHSFPNEAGYVEANGLKPIAVPGRGEQPYAAMGSMAEAASNPAYAWLRANPHRFSLARLSLALGTEGAAPDFASITGADQRLDLWTGTLTSRFTLKGAPVTVVTRVAADSDALLVEITSPLVASGALGVAVRYPGVTPAINPDPSGWTPRAGDTIRFEKSGAGEVRVERTIDATRVWSAVAVNGSVGQAGDGLVARAKGSDRLVLVVRFDRAGPVAAGDEAALAAGTAAHWRDFWTKGAAVDFTGSTDPRASELERRVVLSQYLSAINGAGSLPPQEEGLFSNSWFGKFHLEMHPWHSAWQALWGHPELLERSLGWYLGHLPAAREEAARHRVAGAWWPKMVGPEGRNSPSNISPFLMWQQPHPILLAELVRRAGDGKAALARYGEMVDATADLLASWPLDGASGRKDLGPPLIPAQENYDPLTTRNPTFELEYFRWALGVAEEWRRLRGLPPKPEWERTRAHLAPPAMRDGLYLPAESVPDFWTVAESAACRTHADKEECRNRDHPSFLMADGFIPGDRIDPKAMRRTLDAVANTWDLRQTWGWDYPMIAMTAARVGDREHAVDWLFADRKNNQWGVTGMTPRVHLDGAADALVPKTGGAGGAQLADNPDGTGFRRAAETYFPSNGSLLMAVGLMAGGWDGSEGAAPGFPAKGWTVRAEGLVKAP